ncbi:MAG: hypothetical protein ACE15E_05390 [Acidobacteriota bacterium]
MKHYRFRSSDSLAVPSLLFELKIDLQDMRSGYRYSDWGLFAEAPWIDDLDLEWTADMVKWLDPAELVETPVTTVLGWPELADQKVIRYLTRYYRPRAWKSLTLGIFSHCGESQADFINRCREECRDRREKDLRKVRELFYHRFVELERRLISQAEREEPTESWRARRTIRIQDTFNALREQMSRMLLDANQPISAFPPSPLAEGMGVDGKTRFDALCREFLNRYNEVLTDYEAQASQIEPYLVPLAYSQIEIVSRSILWR